MDPVFMSAQGYVGPLYVHAPTPMYIYCHQTTVVFPIVYEGGPTEAKDVQVLEHNQVAVCHKVRYHGLSLKAHAASNSIRTLNHGHGC